MSKNSFFIVYEGPEGAGKTTQIKRLEQNLINHNISPLLTREPGGTKAADRIREVILDPNLEINPLTEFLLYSASRAQHVEEIIKPALDNKRTVISDRFYGASLAYQGYGRGLDLGFIANLSHRVTLGIEPDLVLLLDIDPEIGLQRIATRGQKDRLELADISFHKKVRAGFLEQANSKANWQILNAEQSQAELADNIWQIVKGKMEL
ncbi:MAG TPA: dTMP kinase [Trueperaceae bacterium]|nr:dTMP kinase [Trueperaceae bacterium]